MFPLPWKLLFRFFSAAMLLFTGGFAAHDITSPPPPPAVVAPAPAPGSTTTTTAPAATDGSTTTTTAPDSTPPVIAVPDPAPTTSTTTPSAPTTSTTAPKPAPAPGPGDVPPAVPVPGNAPAVCAAAAAPSCGPAGATQAPDHAARVQACQDWWNSLATAFDANNRPEWAAQARQIAGQCDAMITRWEQLEQKWLEHHPGPKGDHNADQHPDNGKGPQGQHDGDAGDHAPPPPLAHPVPHVSRHGEGRH